MDEEGLSLGDIFTEPPRPPTPQATTTVYAREYAPKDSNDGSSWKELSIRLVGSHPLWGHHLWNAARAFATYLDEHRDLYKGKNVLELGAGGALPSLVTVKNRAKRVVITDYPDKDLIDNISHNVKQNLSNNEERRVTVTGYIWGQPITSLLFPLPPNEKFDVVILSDLIFNHSQHDALLKTCISTLNPKGVVLVFYTHHRPHLAHRDMEFFNKARSSGWVTTEIVTRRYPPMFPEDSGEEEVRATVHGWELSLPLVQDDVTIEDESKAAPAESSLQAPIQSYQTASLSSSPPPSSLSSPNTKKTLILDLNGTLVYRTKGRAKTSQEIQVDQRLWHPIYGPSPRSSTIRVTWPRPYLPSFIQYISHARTQKWLDTVVWSSARPESVDEVLSKAGFTRRSNGEGRGAWEGLKEVWARDKMGLSFEAYHHKTETIKDLVILITSLYPSISRNSIDAYTAYNTILLDDTSPDKKARLQPYNLLQVSTYDKEERKADVETFAMRHGSSSGSSPPKKKKKPRHRKKGKETAQPEQVDLEEAPRDDSPVPYDVMLLAVIGILEHGAKGQSNVAKWIREGGVGSGVWYDDERILNKWVNVGLQALGELDIEVKSGMTGET